ncbi:HlyD family efflux transporter periplasmic adaptor subunit, partial [Pseudomonas bubulae]
SKGLEDRVSRTMVTSPVRGIVKQMLVNTVGGVIQPGSDIAEVVPLDDTLLVEAKIRPQDIAFLHPGQEAMIKFTAYDYTIYGGLKGKLEQI